jgi:hypothetical protein
VQVIWYLYLDPISSKFEKTSSHSLTRLYCGEYFPTNLSFLASSVEEIIKFWSYLRTSSHMLPYWYIPEQNFDYESCRSLQIIPAHEWFYVMIPVGWRDNWITVLFWKTEMPFLHTLPHWIVFEGQFDCESCKTLCNIPVHKWFGTFIFDCCWEISQTYIRMFALSTSLQQIKILIWFLFQDISCIE